MERTELLARIRAAGIVGAGGAGFPTHVKLNCQAEVVIANAAECEPLLRSDRLLMEREAGKVILGLKLAMQAAGASRGVIAIKQKYYKAIAALEQAITPGDSITLYLMASFYPAGDEQQIVYEVTGQVVPTGGLPLDVGAVVQNVATLMHIADSAEGLPMLDKYVTVTGAVSDPAVFIAPVGTSVRQLINAAGGPKDLAYYTVMIGGPVMGRVMEELDEPVTKTTGGILVFPSDHPLVRKRCGTAEVDLKLAKSVCCQCNLCTMMCPRNALGLKVEPNKIMRALAMNAPEGMGEVNGIFSCCDCGICTLFACNFDLAPSRMMSRVKQQLLKDGIRPVKRIAYAVGENINDIKVPVSRLMKRLSLDQYDRDLPLRTDIGPVTAVRLPLKMHIGQPARPVIRSGERVERGQLIAAVAEGLGAHVHASISGVATLFDGYIEIQG